MKKQQPLQPGEHRSEARRRSWRRYYSRNAVRIRKAAREWYWAHHERALAVKRAYRLRQFRITWPKTKLTAQGWQEIRSYFQTMMAQGRRISFKALAILFKVSPRRIRRRSAADGGWSLRRRTGN